MNFKRITISALALILIVGITSCRKDDKPTPSSTQPSNTTPSSTNPPVSDSLTSKNLTYEASGSFIYTSAATSSPKTYTHQYVKAQYKDMSHIWSDTYYTYMSFYNINATAAAEMITFTFLGKEFPKTGTYKLGPIIIANLGISEADKLLSDEVAIQVVGNGQVSKRDASISINVVNDNGKITITSDNEIKVYDNLMGELKGTCKNINFTRTTNKK